MVMKATTLLETQHRQMEAMLWNLENRTQSAAGQQGVPNQAASGAPQVLKDLASALLAHMATEEEVLYPVARNAREDIVLGSYEEHDVEVMELKRLLQTDPGDPAFQARLLVVKRLLAEHIAREEGELFPAVEKTIGQQELQAIGQLMEARFNQERSAGYEQALARRPEMSLQRLQIAMQQAAHQARQQSGQQGGEPGQQSGQQGGKKSAK